MTNKVDILINGRTYAINCPKGEENALQKASNYINGFVQEVRRFNNQLPQEELLLLCALTLYEKAENAESQTENAKKAQSMIEQMLQDIRKLG